MKKNHLLIAIASSFFLCACAPSSYNYRVIHPEYQKFDTTSSGQKVVVSEKKNSRYIITYLHDDSEYYCKNCVAYKVAVMNKSDHHFNFGVDNFTVKNGDSPVSLMSYADVLTMQSDKMSSHNNTSMILGILMGVAAGLTNAYTSNSSASASALNDYNKSSEETTARLQSESDFVNNKFSNESLNSKTLEPSEAYGGVIVVQNVNYKYPLSIAAVIDGEEHEVSWSISK